MFVNSKNTDHISHQCKLAKLLDESPSCVASLESDESSVSLDLLIRSLLVLGTSKQELARVIAQ